MRTDVLVIGGGPAGLAAAIAARCRGLSVTLADAARPPIDKACGECVLPAGVEVLHGLGVRISEDDGFAIQGIRLVDRGISVEVKFREGPGLALRRTRLHQILTERAIEAGVRLLWGTCASAASELVSSRWVVGADGQNSHVRRAAGLDAASHESSRFGFRRHFRLSPWTDFVEVHWGRRCQVYVTPVSGDEIGIALLSRDRHLRLDNALAEFPELQRRLRGSGASSAERGAATVSRRLRCVVAGRTALVGDASGSVDAITGEGLSLSFHQAVALSEAFASGGLGTYQAAHSRLAVGPIRLASLLLCMDRSPLLRRTILRLLSLEPQMFARWMMSLMGR